MVGGWGGGRPIPHITTDISTQSQITVNVTFTSPLMKAPSSLKLMHNPIITLNMRYRLSHQTGQLQGNGVKVLMWYIPLVQGLLIYYFTADSNTTDKRYPLGSRSATFA
jgi:hypothetical protein